MTIYRKIYEQHHGKIPLDSDGRTMEIHHIDGNRANNSIENLKLVTIQEHYQIHYDQSDWDACQAIALRMATPPETIAELSSKCQKEKVKNGTHPFLGGDVVRKTHAKRKAEGRPHIFTGGDIQRKTHARRLAEGTHHFLDSEYQSKIQKKRIADGTHHWLHPEKIKCDRCGRMVTKANMNRHQNGRKCLTFVPIDV